MAPQDGQRQVRFTDLDDIHSPDGRTNRPWQQRAPSSLNADRQPQDREQHPVSGRTEYSPDPRQADKARPSYLNPHSNHSSYTQDHPQSRERDRERDRDRDRDREYNKTNGNNRSNPHIHSHSYRRGPDDSDEDESRDNITTTTFKSNMPSMNQNTATGNGRYARSPISGEDHSQSRPARPPLPRTPSNTYAPPRGRPSTQSQNRSYIEHHPISRRPERHRRKNPLSNWQRKNLGYDLRNNDSDSEGETPATEDNPFESETIMFSINENQDLTEADYKDPDSSERLNWQSMLASVLSGDVIGQEKKRLTPNDNERNPIPSDELFIALRAAYFRRHESVQRKIIEEARSNLAQQIDAIMNFKVKGEDDAGGKDLMAQVNDVLGSIEKCYSMYPSIKQLEENHHATKTEPFRKSCEAIIAWSNTVKMIELELNTLRLWVGNDDLAIEKSEDGVAKEASSFIHRLLNDGSLRMLYSDISNPATPRQAQSDYRSRDNVDQTQSESEAPEPQPASNIDPSATHDTDPSVARNIDPLATRNNGTGMVINLLRVIRHTKKTIIDFADEFKERHLPPPVEELTTLINFPSRLVQTMLQEQVANAKTTNIKMAARTNALILDQMMLQFKTLLRMSVGINKQYLEIIESQRNWDVPDSVDETYVQDVFIVLRFYFKMLNWKLANNKNTFKEAEVLGQEWDFAHSIGSHFANWETELAENFSHVTSKALSRLADTFEREMNEKADQSTSAMSKRIKACLDSVRVRQRMLQRFSRLLNDSYENASDYSIPLEKPQLRQLFDTLALSNHVQLLTRFDEQGYMIICSPSIFNYGKLDYVQIMMAMTSAKQIQKDSNTYYVLLIKAEEKPIWTGKKVKLELDEQVLDLQTGHLRLLATSTDKRQSEANEAFLDTIDMKLDLVMDRRSNLTKVHQKLTELRRVAYKISNIAMASAESIRNETRGKGCEELVHTCFMSATEFGQRALHYMDENRRQMNNIKLSKLALDWVSFIDEDCIGTDKRTFRWAMQALDFVSAMTRGRQILGLSDVDWARLRRSVSGCMKMLVLHLDVMGARSSVQAKAEQDRKYEAYEKQAKLLEGRLRDDEKAAQLVSESRMLAIEKEEKHWLINNTALLGVGRVLEDTNELDRSLMDMSSATNNGSIRWQLGQFVGAGAFGRVYVGVNLSRGQMMAVKEIRLQQDSKVMTKIKGQIIREVNLLKALDHPNIVTCYGVEVRRDRVYIFMELCSGGSLAGLIEHGPIDDEIALQEVTLSMLEGLKYLHDNGIVHCDIKPANVLLDHSGIVKFVDFGAAKVLHSQNDAIHNSQTLSNGETNGHNLYNSSHHDKKASTDNSEGTAGTPMYMAPETIRDKENVQDPKAADIWSLGCVVLELATGQQPWPKADNEFAVMYNIGNGLLPEMPTDSQLSETGRDFILRCLCVEPSERATVDDLMRHPWIQSAIAANKELEAETPSDSSQNGTPSGVRGPTDGMFPGADQ